MALRKGLYWKQVKANLSCGTFQWLACRYKAKKDGGHEMDSLNDLIYMAASMLDSGFDVHAFLLWKKMAFIALVGLFGPLHYYSLNFRRITSPNPVGLLAGEGMLSAAKEELGSCKKDGDK
jgi:hypothetical protein